MLLFLSPHVVCWSCKTQVLMQHTRWSKKRPVKLSMMSLSSQNSKRKFSGYLYYFLRCWSELVICIPRDLYIYRSWPVCLQCCDLYAYKVVTCLYKVMTCLYIFSQLFPNTHARCNVWMCQQVNSQLKMKMDLYNNWGTFFVNKTMTRNEIVLRILFVNCCILCCIL